MTEDREDRLARAVEESLSLAGGEDVEHNEYEGEQSGAPYQPEEDAVGKGSGEDAVFRPVGPVGVDIGTNSIVIAESREGKIHTLNQTRFPCSIPFVNFTKNIPAERQIPYFEMGNLDYLLGYAEADMVDSFHSLRSLPAPGDLAPEHESISLIEAILRILISRPRTPATPLCYSVPGKPLNGLNTLVYHSAILKMFFSQLGYSSMPIDEGLAVIMSELADNKYTGIGISIGAGMTNICLAYLSVPVASFCLQTGGDYIDNMASAVTGELASDIRSIKENSLSLADKPAKRIDVALHVYYEDLIQSVVTALRDELQKTSLPKIGTPVPIVLSGGTVKADGFKNMFEEALATVRLPLKISSVRMAEDPSTAVAKGALMIAEAEEL